MTHTQHHIITTVVGPLAVRTTGEGPPAVLWHSLFVDDHSWDRAIPLLAPHRRLVVICGPGHGTSGDPGRRYDMDDCADAALTVLAEIGVREPVDWVGNAWGGHVGMVIAGRGAPQLRSLVNLGAPTQAYSRSGRLQTQLLTAVHRVAGPVGFLRSAVVETLLSSATRSTDPEAVAYVDACLARSEASLRNAVHSISLDRTDLHPVLGSIRVPTLFVTGGDHSGWTPAQARADAALVPGGRCVVVPDTAYLIPLEAPAATANLVIGFWAERATEPADPS